MLPNTFELFGIHCRFSNEWRGAKLFMGQAWISPTVSLAIWVHEISRDPDGRYEDHVTIAIEWFSGQMNRFQLKATGDNLEEAKERLSHSFKKHIEGIKAAQGRIL